MLTRSMPSRPTISWIQSSRAGRGGPTPAPATVYHFMLTQGVRIMDEARFVEAVRRNPVNRLILERLPGFGLADAWLVSGAVFQTVWNVLTGRAPHYGIKDYDIFYFDTDTSWEAEDAVIHRVAAAVSDVGVSIEPRNQARVHLWYANKFGSAYSPLRRATEGIDRFLARAAQVGVRPAEHGYEVYAPHGFADISTLTIRPNRCANFRPDLYEAKAVAWKARWPELCILPAIDMQS
jgi:hypothetical protein